MKTFKEYITEMFDTSAEVGPYYHPDYEFIPAGVGSKRFMFDVVDTHLYRGDIRDSEAEYRVSFMAKKIEDGVSKMSFAVNYNFDKPPTPIPPHHALAIGKKIHEYFHHHMMTQRPREIVYDTDDPVKHSIYQAMASRYGVTATNITQVNSRKKSRR